MKASEKIQSVSSVLSKLEYLHTKYCRNENGHRATLLEILQSAQYLHLKLRQNKSVRKKFLNRVGKGTRAVGETARRPNLAMAVVVKITGSKSRRARQRAWKYGTVLKILADAGITASNTAAEIKARGGLDKTIKASSAQAEAKERIDIKQLVSSRSNNAPETTGCSEPTNAKSKNATITNNGEVLAEVFMRLADRDEIHDAAIGTEFTLRAIRIPHRKADLKIRSVKVG